MSTLAFVGGSGRTLRNRCCHDLWETLYSWTLSFVWLPFTADFFPFCLCTISDYAYGFSPYSWHPSLLLFVGSFFYLPLWMHLKLHVTMHIPDWLQNSKYGIAELRQFANGSCLCFLPLSDLGLAPNELFFSGMLCDADEMSCYWTMCLATHFGIHCLGKGRERERERETDRQTDRRKKMQRNLFMNRTRLTSIENKFMIAKWGRQCGSDKLQIWD